MTWAIVGGAIIGGAIGGITTGKWQGALTGAAGGALTGGMGGLATAAPVGAAAVPGASVTATGLGSGAIGTGMTATEMAAAPAITMPAASPGLLDVMTSQLKQGGEKLSGEIKRGASNAVQGAVKDTLFGSGDQETRLPAPQGRSGNPMVEISTSTLLDPSYTALRENTSFANRPADMQAMIANAMLNSLRARG